jgi:methionine synthase II (cobalamin-independent)
MFATLLGALPRPTFDEDGESIAPVDTPGPEGIEDLVAAAVRAQEAAGLEPVTDGRLGDPEFARFGALLGDAVGTDRVVAAVLEAWRRTSAAATHAAKQALPGPYSLGIRAGGDGAARARVMSGAAEAIAEVVAALAVAGCPLVEIVEWEAHRARDDAEAGRLADAHRRLTEAGHASAIHRSLSITGGSVRANAIDPILELPYASLAVDLVAGADNWYLVRRASRDQGILVGVLSGGEEDEGREVMLWAANYASTGSGRARERVGLGSAGSWADLTWQAALRKLDRLGDAARLATMSPSEELIRQLDPRAVSKRRAAMGHPPDPDGGSA